MFEDRVHETLVRMGGAVSLAELAYQLKSRPGRVSKALQSLEDEGLVEPSYWRAVPQGRKRG